MAWHEGIDAVRRIGSLPALTGITHDSRLVETGWGFIALPGSQTDGHDFLDQALTRGAAALIVQADREETWRRFSERAPILGLSDTRAAAGLVSANVMGNPSRSLRLIGVTGTDGKTSTAHITAHVLSRSGLACGYLSSVGFETGSGFTANETHMTTLEAPLIQAHLAAAVRTGLQAMVVEASSEGLAQGRLNACEFDIGVFTNLTRDHLDFHGTMENYLAAKQRLFEMTEAAQSKNLPRAAVVNGDDAAGLRVAASTSLPSVRFGFGADNDVRALRADERGLNLEVEVLADGARKTVRTNMAGKFNAYNCLAAISVARTIGLDFQASVEALASFPGIPGRLERVDEGQDFQVFVDIASTPAAMEQALSVLRQTTNGNLWVVFGAAGGRDSERRGGLGRVVGRLADRAVVANEDPRHEDPDEIIAAIAAGLHEAGRLENRDFFRVPDRREAIQFAFEQAAAGDSVLLAGKATEPTMVFGAEERPWDERAEARRLLAGADA